MIAPRFSGTSISFPIFLPFTVTLPCVTGTKPHIHFISIVFPEPLRPISPCIFPFSKEIFTSFNTVAAPYFFVTCEISIISLIYTSLSAHQCSFLTIISCFLPKNTAKNVSTAISSTYIPST